MISQQKYQQIKEILRHTAPTKPEGFTVTEVAEITGVCRKTVRRVINGWEGPKPIEKTIRLGSKVYHRCQGCRNLVDDTPCRICFARKERERNSQEWKPTLGPIGKEAIPNQEGMSGVCSICGSGPITFVSPSRWKCHNCKNICEWCPPRTRVVELCAKIRSGEIVLDRA